MLLLSAYYLVLILQYYVATVYVLAPPSDLETLLQYALISQIQKASRELQGPARQSEKG